MSQDKIKIRIPDVLGMLKDGKTRDEIGEHYGLSKADTKRLFLHPDLKGKKTVKKRELPFEIVEEGAEEETSSVGEALAQSPFSPPQGATQEWDNDEEE